MQTAKGSVVETSDEVNGMNAAKLLLVDRRPKPEQRGKKNCYCKINYSVDTASRSNVMLTRDIADYEWLLVLPLFLNM